MPDPVDPVLLLPDSILVEDLQKTNPVYDADRIERFEHLYRAGKQFREHVEEFLEKRPLEEKVEGAHHYRNRIKKAWYIPRGPGLIDWIVAAVMRSEPRISAPQDKSGYWESLNSNADGNRTDLAALCKKSLIENLLHGRSALLLSAETKLAIATDKNSEKYRFKVLEAKKIDDWERNSDGIYQWVRCHHTVATRPAPYLPAAQNNHRWTYITSNQITAYQATPGADGNLNPKSFATRIQNEGHDFGALPVYPIRCDPGMWVMERIHDPLVALFNREVSITYALDQLAYAILAMITQDGTDATRVVDATLGAMLLKIGEDLKYVAPPPDMMESLFKDAERLCKCLYEVLQAMSVNAMATQTQNARQSAQAKAMDRDPLQTLLASFAWPLQDALEAAIEDLKKFRKDTFEVKLTGFEHFSATMDDLQAFLDSQNEDLSTEKTPKEKPAKKEPPPPNDGKTQE